MLLGVPRSGWSKSLEASFRSLGVCFVYCRVSRRRKFQIYESFEVESYGIAFADTLTSLSWPDEVSMSLVVGPDLLAPGSVGEFVFPMSLILFRIVFL